MYKCIDLFVVVITAIGYAAGHSYHLGSCPIVEPMTSFEMSRMLGKWYVIQKTSTASRCIMYEFKRGEEPGEYFLVQDSQHFLLGLTPLKHDYKYTGTITMEDAAVPAKMRIRFPLSIAGSASFTVFSTDYDNYAGIFTCQKLAFAHRRSATILSRSYDLDKMYVDKVRSRLASFNVDPYDLSIISQNDCPKNTNDSSVNINIDPDTLSAHNIGNAVKTAGEKIGEGVEYTIESGKKVYHYLAHDTEEGTNTNNKDKEPITAQHFRGDYEKDAEWLP